MARRLRAGNRVSGKGRQGGAHLPSGSEKWGGESKPLNTQPRTGPSGFREKSEPEKGDCQGFIKDLSHSNKD